MIQLKSDKEVKRFERMPKDLEDQIRQQKQMLSRSPIGITPDWNNAYWKDAFPPKQQPLKIITEDIEFEDVTHKRLGDGN